MQQHATTLTLFVGGLSYFCKEKDLHDLFSQYGYVVSVTIIRKSSSANERLVLSEANKPILSSNNIVSTLDEIDPRDIPSSEYNDLFYGKIEFTTLDERRAIESLHKQIFMGRILKVSKLLSDVIMSNNSEQTLVPVHFSFATRMTNTLVTETLMKDLLVNDSGIVIYDIYLAKFSFIPSSVETNLARQAGHGFLFVSSFAEEDQLSSIYRRHTLHNITFDCNPSKQSIEMRQRLNYPRVDVNGSHNNYNRKQPSSTPQYSPPLSLSPMMNPPNFMHQNVPPYFPSSTASSPSATNPTFHVYHPPELYRNMFQYPLMSMPVAQQQTNSRENVASGNNSPGTQYGIPLHSTPVNNPMYPVYPTMSTFLPPPPLQFHLYPYMVYPGRAPPYPPINTAHQYMNMMPVTNTNAPDCNSSSGNSVESNSQK